MKKFFVICFPMVLFACSAKAQITYGIKGGINVSTIHSSIKSGAGSLAGLNFGGLANYSLNKKFALQAELLYSNQGYGFPIESKAYSFAGIETINHYYIPVRLNYINIPLMVQYHIVPRVYIEAGPQFGILASVKGMHDGLQYKSTDFSAGVGAGYIFKKINLGISARYTSGLSNINKYTSAEKEMKNHNKVFQLGVFYKFGKRK
jgi:hypothetical protein